MRILTKRECRQRGCTYCLNFAREKSDVDVKGNIPPKIGKCKYTHCPFRELDRYKDFREYLRDDNQRIEKVFGRYIYESYIK